MDLLFYNPFPAHVEEYKRKGKVMLKQKIAQWCEYRDSKENLRLEYAKFVESYRNWKREYESLSITKYKGHIHDAMQEPKLFGTPECPCVVNHTYKNPFNNTSFIWPEDLKQTFYCKNYEKYSACSNWDCIWHADNLVTFIAWNKCERAAEKVMKATDRYKNARRAFWGEKRSNTK